MKDRIFTFLSWNDKTFHKQGWDVTAAEIRLVAVAETPYVEQQFKEVACNGNAVHGLDALSFFNQESLYSNRNVPADRITTGRSFEMSYINIKSKYKSK